MNPISNFIKNSIGVIFNLSLGFIFLTITAKLTDPEFFGKIAVLQLLEVLSTSIFMILQGSIITKDISYMYARKEIDKKYISTVLLTPFITSPIFLIVLFFPPYAIYSIPYIILFMYYSYLYFILIGLDDFSTTTISSIISSTFRWGISLIAIFERDIYLFTLIWTLGAVSISTFLTMRLLRKIGNIKLVFDFNIFKRIFKDGFYVFLSSITGYFASYGDRILTVFLLGGYSLGLYQFSALVSSFVGRLISAIGTVILPAASYYKAKDIEERFISRIMFKAMSYISLIFISLSSIIIYIVLFYFFTDYTSTLYTIKILFVAVSMFSIFGIFNIFIIAFEKERRPLLYLSIINSIAIVLLSILLIPKFEIVGAAISQLLASFISSIYLTYVVVKNRSFVIDRKIVLIFLIIGIAFLYILLSPQGRYYILLPFIILLYYKLMKIFDENEKELIIKNIPTYIGFIKPLVRIFL